MDLWDWLKQPEIAGTVGAIAGVVGVLWTVFTYFRPSSSNKSSESISPTVTAENKGVAIGGNVSKGAIVSTGDITIQQDPLVAEIIETLKQRLAVADLREQEKDDQIKALTESITALAQQKDQPDALPGIEEALQQLAEGNTQKAEAIFQETTKRKEADIQEAAAAHRHLGALAFLHNTPKALNAYRRATQLDPDNGQGWNQLGHLLRRTGQLKDAEAAYQRVLALGEKRNNQGWIAAAYTNLGNIYYTRGELEQTEAMYQKSLAIEKALGHQEGMASAYTNLGNVYHTRGELEQAEAMYQKSLALNEALGRKEGMAIAYGNLGNVYRIRGELEQAEAIYQKSLGLFQEIGAEPQIKQVQELLDALQ